MNTTYPERWIAWALVMGLLIGVCLGLLSAEFGVFPR